MRFFSKEFQNHNKYKLNFLNFFILLLFTNLSHLLRKKMWLMLGKSKIRREASLLFFWSKNLFHWSVNKKSTEVGIHTSEDWKFTKTFQWLDLNVFVVVTGRTSIPHPDHSLTDYRSMLPSLPIMENEKENKKNWIKYGDD